MRGQRPKRPSASRAKAPEAEVVIHGDQLFTELRELIESCRSRLARSVNRELVLLYWRIGTRLAKEVLGGVCLFEAANLDEALELAARIPVTRFGAVVEIRPVVTR